METNTSPRKRRVFLKGAKREAARRDLRAALDHQWHSPARGAVVREVAAKHNIAPGTAWKLMKVAVTISVGAVQAVLRGPRQAVASLVLDLLAKP